MDQITKTTVNCMYCDETFDLNTEVCNDKNCENVDITKIHYKTVEDDWYEEFLDHMEDCRDLLYKTNRFH
jgi:hypothetical protein